VRVARPIDDPRGIRTARTLPAAAYADGSVAARERDAVFRNDWVCIGTVDDLPAAGTWRSVTAATLPVLLVADLEGEVRAFLDVCRHRGAPLCGAGSTGAGSVIRCPYHSWIYRLDGTLARASGVGEPDGFDPDEHGLFGRALHVWRRTVWIGPEDAAPFDPGPLGAAIASFDLEAMELVLAERHERACNWKVLVENYSENYHTPFVHPEIDTSATEDYPMVSDGRVLYAWDRPLRPDDEAGRLRNELLPGEPGWERLGTMPTARAYDVGSYLTVWPNLMMNVFPDSALLMWVEPLGARRCVVERRLLARHGLDSDVLTRIVEAHRLVHAQDIDICERVQRTHDAGIDVEGRLATVEERGVFFVHEQWRRSMGPE
jgi:glycine betaine catabolism A